MGSKNSSFSFSNDACSMNRLCPKDIKEETTDVKENILENLQDKKMKQILPDAEISKQNEFAKMLEFFEKKYTDYMSEKTTKVETQMTSQDVDLNRELLLDFLKNSREKNL